MGRKGNDLLWAYDKIIREFDACNRKELEYVCNRLKKIRYVSDIETDEIRGRIYEVFESPLIYSSQLIYAISLFLEFVDVNFLRDLYLNSPNGFIESSCEKLPLIEAEVIIQRMREAGIIDELLEKFLDEAECLLEFEL